jgi:phosphoribosylformylglycinamidine synthase PurS subunit
MIYTAEITISLKEGMLDPEARAIEQALANLGLKTEGLTTGRVFWVKVAADDEASARVQAEEFCRRLLANPVIHRYSIEVSG